MKKDKIEIVLIIGIIFFSLAAGLFYHQSKQIIITNEIPYSELGNINYRVHLNDKTYYDKEYLDEGMQYISSIIDYIDVDFKYNANYDGVKEYNVTKNATAYIVVADTDNNKVIYTKNEVIKDEKGTEQKLNIDDSIRIDYTKYNSLVNGIKSKYGISADCMLKVEYNIGYSTKEGINSNKRLTIDIPLSKQMIDITKGNPINNSDVYTTQDNNSVFNGIMTICMIVMILLGVSCASALLLRIRDRIRKESKYDRFIKRVLREYDSYITEAKESNNVNDKSVIKINSFKELLDVRNNIDKAIIYTKIDNNTSKFQIIDDEVYEYVVKRKELDD